MADGKLSGADAPAHHQRSTATEKFRWLVEKCALPLALVLLPIIYQSMAAHLANKANAATNEQAKATREAKEKKDQDDQKFQLHLNLLSQREEADSAVRRGLFDKLIGVYVEPDPKDPYKKLVRLELLALNFHDAVNLSPLFWDLHRLIEQMPSGARRDDLREQLDRVAKEVKDRQAAVLEVDGFSTRMDVPLTFLYPGSSSWSTTINAPQLGDAAVPGVPATREFSLTVSENDAKNRRLFVMVDSPGMKNKVGFWVDAFDFPLVNFVRISPTERVAVMLDAYDNPKGTARLVLLYFPSSRSAAKDKPYIDDLVNKLLPAPVKTGSAAAPGAGGIAPPGK